MVCYEDGKEYFLKGKVKNGDSLGWPVEFVYNNGFGMGIGKFTDVSGLLLTASEVAATIKDNKLYTELVDDKNAEIALYANEVKKLRSENDSLKDAVEVLKEQKKGLEKTIDKHETTIEERTIECNRWEGMYDKASKKCDELRKKSDELTAWYEEANKTASEAAEANDELKAKVAKLKADLDQRNKDFWAMKKDRDELDSIGGKLRAENEALKDKDDLQKAVEALNKDIDGYRATIQKMAAVIGFLCGAGEVNNG